MMRPHGDLAALSAAVALALLVFTVALLSGGNTAATAADGQSSDLLPGSLAQGYQIDKQTEAYRLAIAAADTNDASTWGDVPAFVLEGRPNMFVSGRFSGASGDTADVKIAYYYRVTRDGVNTDTYKGCGDIVTLTALDGLDEDGDNEAEIVGFDGRGSNMVKVIVTSLSAGTIDLWVGSH